MPGEDNLNISAKDLQHAVNLGNRVWWVGHYIPNDIFQCHVYLIEHGDNSVLIDPGGYLTFKQVYKKVQEIIPFSHIRYFVCHHQDPDITSSLKLIELLPDVRKDAVIVTHWRAKQLIKHYNPAFPFWNIEEHDWQLDLGGRVLKFIFTPYLHFPGAFCTFDFLSGILFSSDIFGGFTTNWTLFAQDESYFEDMRPFHEHYMPSREVLISGLMKLEEYPIKMIAPQHGSIIPTQLVGFMIKKLKQIDCGLYALAKDSTDIRRLSFLNKSLRDITHAIIIYRDFRDIVNELLVIFRKVLPVTSIEFYTYSSKRESLYCFAPENRYHGIITEMPSYCSPIMSMDKNAWKSQNQVCYKKILALAKHISYMGKAKDYSLLVPLFSMEGGLIQSIAIIWLSHDVDIIYETEKMVEQMSEILGVAVERECLFRMLDIERKKLYDQAVHDPLTGLYNRLYMEDTLKQYLYIHDRNEKNVVTDIMLDIDHFKQINDTFGHATGDEVLRRVASVLISNLRLSDLAVRYGGEEFGVFLFGYTLKDGIMIAEKIRNAVSLMTFEDLMNKHRLTISAGVASHRQNESVGDFIHRADVALYKAKTTGRNKVCFDETSM